MGSRTKKKDKKGGDGKTLKPRQMIDNLPTNGDGKPDFPDKVDAGELTIMSGAIMEVEGLRKKETALQRELTLTSADFIRKGDDLVGRLNRMNQKYGIRRGVRELDMNTGMILDVTQPAKPPKPVK